MGLRTTSHDASHECTAQQRDRIPVGGEGGGDPAGYREGKRGRGVPLIPDQEQHRDGFDEEQRAEDGAGHQSLERGGVSHEEESGRDQCH